MVNKAAIANKAPAFILYAQHGWADDGQQMATLADQLVTTEIPVIAPSLGYVETWLRIEPLIQAVEKIVLQTQTIYANPPMRIIGHSMGGLIWLEVLHRHPEWWDQVHSLVMIASPVGGADWGRIIDPLNLGIGIARDLGINRRAIAASIAARIPTLIIAGDLGGGSDGTIPVGSTKFLHARFISIAGISHPNLRSHPAVVEAIRDFWTTPGGKIKTDVDTELDYLIQRLQAVPGMTDADHRNFAKARLLIKLTNGVALHTWDNPWGAEHIYVVDPKGYCQYAGFVGWFHRLGLQQTLAQIAQELALT